MKKYTKEQILEIVDEYSTIAQLSGEHFGMGHVLDEYGVQEEQMRSWLANPDYYQCPYCEQIDPCPSVRDIQRIQKSLSIPEKPSMQSFDLSNEYFGSIQFDCSKQQEFTVSLKGHPTEKWSVHDLEENTTQAVEKRLMIGWSIHSIYMFNALQTRAQIPHPLEALKYTADDVHRAEYWKWWAVQAPKL